MQSWLEIPFYDQYDCIFLGFYSAFLSSLATTGGPSYCVLPEWHQLAHHSLWSSTGLLSLSGELNHSQWWKIVLPRPQSSLQITK